MDRYEWLERVLGHCDLTATQKLVLIALWACTDDLGANARPGTQALARLCRVGSRAVDGALAAGRRLELLEQTSRANPRRRQMAEYRLTLPIPPSSVPRYSWY
ncbi:MAG: hypothetical protein PGN27_04240 [Mycolicibacterium neoaurum]|uniref:hypothetical protein n=1 Tax=Mycolicibacterium neoaurum TaxID=1795 RepID=UPI002FFC82F7